MGARFENSTGTLPLKIIGRKLKNSTIEVKIASAQIKSGLIFLI